MNEFENEPIKYARYKSYFTTKIVYVDGEYKVLKTTVWAGFDVLEHKWVSKIKTEKQILPLSEYHTKPSKSVVQTFYVRRTGSDSMLRPIAIYVKMQKKFEVVDSAKNVFLVMVNGHVFMNDLNENPSGCACAPVSQRGHPLLKVTLLSETLLTPEEMAQFKEIMDNPKIPIKPLLYEQNASGELKLSI